MANTIKIKRSAVSGKVHTTGDLQLGELAVNTFDGKLYTKKDNGTASIVEIGAGGGGGTANTVIAESQYLINSNYTLTSNCNGISVGPVEIAATYAVTVPANATWMVLL